MRFVRQPDGRLAWFHEILIDFTAWHMTVDEARAWAIDECGMSLAEAEREVREALEDMDLPNDNHPLKLGRWIRSWEVFRLAKSPQRFEKQKKLMGFGDPSQQIKDVIDLLG